MLTERRFSPVHISELASAIATLEFNHGNVKRSRQLFDLSLENPTENSIAQAAWASRQNSSIRIDDKHLNRPNTYEARARFFYSKSRWKEVIKECELWLFDQPFSSRPCEYGSYVAAVALEDYKTCQRFTERGLIVNPADFTLLNNLAFARINLDDIEGAKEALSKIDRSQLSNGHQVVLQATQGLLAFRTGDVAVGRQLYLNARSEARKTQHQDDSKLLALASVFHAIEEISQRVSDNKPMLFEALQAVKRVHDPIFRVLERKLTKMIPHKNKNTKPTQ